MVIPRFKDLARVFRLFGGFRGRGWVASVAASGGALKRGGGACSYDVQWTGTKRGRMGQSKLAEDLFSEGFTLLAVGALASSAPLSPGV